MTNDEIINLYKFAKDPNAEITILAELTLKPTKKIVSIIREAGYTVDDTKVHHIAYNHFPWTADEDKQLLDLSAKGLSYKKIGITMSRTKDSVKNRLYKLKRGVVNV